MIWVLTYAIMLHHQQSLQGSEGHYKRDVVDQFYGSLSYAELADKRLLMEYKGSHPVFDEPDEWIPDATQCKWFRRAMVLVEGQNVPPAHGSIKPITFDAFDTLCDEFITE
jgi:hypothetical protein